MIDVYYPYFAREARWEELRYSLRSIDKHLKDLFRVWIVGDLPDWIRPGSVTWLRHKRCEGMPENTTFDAITKLMMFIDHPDSGLDFIRMYDDIYLVGDCSVVDINRFRALYDHSGIPDRHGIWWDQLRRTIREVRKKGYHGWNTETHLPEMFNKEKMRWVITRYSALEKRLLTSTLYFNTFFQTEAPLMWPECHGIQFYNNMNNEFYTSSSGDLSKKCLGKLFLNHNNAGLNDNLKQFISGLFPEKSRFEL